MKIEFKEPEPVKKNFKDYKRGEAFIVGRYAIFMKINNDSAVDLRDATLMNFFNFEKYEPAKVKIVRDEE